MESVSLSKRSVSRRCPALLVAIGVALVVAPVAVGGSYTWSGHVGINPPHGNGQCVNWYPSQSACSGWAYWNQLNSSNNGGDRVLAGYQNHDAIRGKYLNSGDSLVEFPGDVGMSGYLQSGITYCSWSPCVPSSDDAYVWFKVWN